MVDVWLPYGNTEVCLRVPIGSFLGTIKPDGETGNQQLQEEIEKALQEDRSRSVYSKNYKFLHDINMNKIRFDTSDPSEYSVIILT